MAERNEVEILAQALKQALVDDEHSPILVKSRIQRICDDITSIKVNVFWMRWFIMGIACGIGSLLILFLSRMH